MQHCSTYEDSGDCSECEEGWVVKNAKCIKKIDGCGTYFDNATCSLCFETFTISTDHLSCNCATGYHIGVLKNKCYIDLEKCIKYDIEIGSSCSECQEKYEL